MVKHAPLINAMHAAEDPAARFAVIAMSGKQYKVSVDDTIVADNMDEVDIDSFVKVDDVLMVGGQDHTLVGRPFVPGASVTLQVEELAKDKKIHIYKLRRRKNSQNLRGFRRQVTILRVTDIDVPE